MSYLDTKQACLTQLINNLPVGVTTADIAFENKAFQPANKSLWLAVYFIPVSSEPMGKSIIDSDSQRGFFQVSVFIPIGGKYGDDLSQLTAIDEILSAFPNSSSSMYNTQTVCFLNSTVNGGQESESWFQRDITINYLTTSNRG